MGAHCAASHPCVLLQVPRCVPGGGIVRRGGVGAGGRRGAGCVAREAHGGGAPPRPRPSLCASGERWARWRVRSLARVRGASRRVRRRESPWGVVGRASGPASGRGGRQRGAANPLHAGPRRRLAEAQQGKLRPAIKVADLAALTGRVVGVARNVGAGRLGAGWVMQARAEPLGLAILYTAACFGFSFSFGPLDPAISTTSAASVSVSRFKVPIKTPAGPLLCGKLKFGFP